MEIKIGLLMDLPDGKLPGFYAQIVKTLASKTALFDRDKEMLIVRAEQDAAAVMDVMSQYKVEIDTMELLLLPSHAEVTPIWSDYGFAGFSEHHYLYAKLVSAFQFVPSAQASEPAQAIAQMEEHLIARYTDNNRVTYIVDKQFEELMHGIAKAYRCEVSFL